MFDRLSVFQGGWTLTAAEAVLDDDDARPGEVLDTDRPAGRALHGRRRARPDDPLPDARDPAPVRRRAACRAGEAVEQTRRHADYFHDVVERAERRAARARAATRRCGCCSDEQPNIRAALALLGGPDGDVDPALEMAGSLGLFWHLGRHLEGREVLSRLVWHVARGSPRRALVPCRRSPSSSVPAAAWCTRARRAPRPRRRASPCSSELGDDSRAALSRVLLAVEGVTGADARTLAGTAASAEQQFRADGDDWGLGVIGFVRMETALKTGDLETAVAVGRSAAAPFRQLDDYWGLSAILYHLGWGLRQFGRNEEGARAL